MLLWEIWKSAALNTALAECSRFLSQMSGIPVVSILFLQSYCSAEFAGVSRIMILCCKFAIVAVNLAFSFRIYLIIMFLALIISSCKSWKFSTMLLLNFVISSAKSQLELVSEFK